MANIDQWLAKASDVTASAAPDGFVENIENRLDGESSPQALFLQRNSRKVMICAGLAAMLTFTGMGFSTAIAAPPPMWVAAPPASSPFGLLVGS